MKLNIDCVRDILLYLEELLEVDIDKNQMISVSLHQIQNHFETKYAPEDVWYTILKFREAKFIDGTFMDSNKSKMFICNIDDIMWDGHNFLNNIRPKSICDATKAGAKKLGTVSIAALSMISSEITKTIVTKPEVIDNIVSLIKWNK